MDEIMFMLNSRMEGIDSEFAVVERKTIRSAAKTSILPLYGVISQKMNLMSEYSGGTSTELFGKWLDDSIADKSVGAIVIDVDSPGGSVYGVSELSRKIYNARGKKKIIAVANSLMASAAYWIASAADEIHVTSGGEVGSIGVIAVHVDRSEANKSAGLSVSYITAGKYKAEGNFDEPLDKEAKDYIQSRVDDYYSMFISDVARNRKISSAEVASKFGQGRVVGADMAIKNGMADKKSSLDWVLRTTAK
jgi:signal peptide peptidase SppA